MIEIRDVTQKILFEFDNAIVDLDALYCYFVETRDLINTKKVSFQSKRNIAYQLVKLLDEIYTFDDAEKREKYISSIHEKTIEDIDVKDIIEISWVENEATVKYSLKNNYQKKEFDPVTARRKWQSICNQESIFARSVLSNIIIVFEQFFSSQYETLVVSNPKAYFEDKKIPVSQLFDNEISQILVNLVKQDVEANMFDSLKTLDKIKEKSKIDIDRYLPIRDEFEEIYYRRNAYVHTAGRVNKTYLEKVNKKYTNKLKEGSKLICDDIYLENAIFTVYKIIASLHFELLKVNNVEQEKYETLSSLGFDALQEGRYGLAEYIYGILRREHQFEYKDKAIYEVNYINSLKLQGKDISALLEKFDVSIATDDFKIAKECLLDNHEKVYSLLTNSYPNSFDSSMIENWPIFIKFRESEFYQRFIDEHKNDFVKTLSEQEFDEIVED